ncbi:MAG: hypothetical protein JWO88_1677, partial [Frankiales bacterium]|nr:hypothetical protein [Frankiales bacterium]
TSGGHVSGSGASGPAGPTGASSVNGPGVTATTIALGIPYCSDCAAANSAAGAGGEDPGDTRRYTQAVLDDINARGGVLGRKLVVVWQSVSASADVATSQQAACARWTQDHKVFAMFFQGEIVYQCAKKAGVLAYGAGGTGPIYARYPNVFAPPDTRLERLGAVTVKSMVHADWQKPAPKWPTGKIGLITWDDNDYKYSMKNGWLPALHDAGLKETDVRYVAVPQAGGAMADASAAISSDVLAFRQEGIDHVFISDGTAGIFTGAGLTLLFLENAKSQGYFPRYGFNTNNAPGWSNLPADEESGMLAVDSLNYKPESDAGTSPNAQRDRCFGLMRKRGLPVGDDATRIVALTACDPVWFVEAALRRTQGTTLPYMIAAAESLGTSYRSPFSYGNRLSHTQHDGAALFRSSAFDDGCSCMKYASKPYEP